MIGQYISIRTLRFLLIISIFIGLFAFSIAPALPSRANSPAEASALLSRHPDAGIWVMYKGKNSAADLQQPYIQGIMAYAPWNVTYTGPNEFNWETLDAELDFIINQVGKRAMVDIPAGYCPQLDWPAWIHHWIATHKATNDHGCYPFQFWDPIYIDLHKVYIQRLATHLARFDASDARPDQTDIIFVRAEVMAETMENLPNDSELAEWKWQNFESATNGRIYQVDLTTDLKYEYQAEITLAYQRELRRAYAEVGLKPPVAAAKGGHYWQEYPTRDRFVNEGVWMDQHGSSPNPQGWYYDMYSKVRSGETRGASETGGRSPDTLLAQYAYWEILANLHYGVEFIGIYGNNKFSPELQPNGAINYPENREALEFGTRYAGAYRDPATSPGAWIALRGGYPEESFGGKVFARRMWTNYEFLMTQYRPQQSVLLFGIDHKQNQVDSLTPIVKRNSKKPWRNEIRMCQKQFSVQQCEYLWQQPDKYLGKKDNNYEYTYRTSDLGRVVYCGINMFCGNAPQTTRVETMLWARRTNDDFGFPFMRFDLNDEFAQSLNGQTQIRVVYLDQGSGEWELRYDSQSGAEKSAIVVKKYNSNQWKEVVVDVDDAAFNNGLEGGTDLSLFNMGDDDDIFHMIEVLRVEAEE